MQIRLHKHPKRAAPKREPAGSVLVAGRATLRDRMSARWRPARLDRALAEGAPPESSPALALRARRLTALSRRRSLAGALRRIVREALEDARVSRGRVRPDRNGVEAAREELTALADGLADPRPVAAHGVAQAWLLVTDGTGPLYNACSRRQSPRRRRPRRPRTPALAGLTRRHADAPPPGPANRPPTADRPAYSRPPRPVGRGGLQTFQRSGGARRRG